MRSCHYVRRSDATLGGVHSIPEFLLVAMAVTITPGPGTATIIRVTARDGRGRAVGTVAGNSLGVLTWALLSAVGVSSLILASQIAYDVLRIGGAAFLIALGLRSLLRRDRAPEASGPRHARDTGKRSGAAQGTSGRPGRGAGWRIGIVTSLSNPKLAVFFIALFPEFLTRHAAVLPAALTMGAVIVAFDLLWFGSIIYLVDRARAMLRPKVQRRMERVTGGVLVGVGAFLAARS
jgi:threonine/homoserine/homoserine lactone efflux protein